MATVKETRKKFTWVWLFYHPSCFYFSASDYVESTISIFCARMLLMNCASPLVIFICFVVRDEGEKTRAEEDIENEPVASPLVYGVDCCQVPGFQGRLMNLTP